MRPLLLTLVLIAFSALAAEGTAAPGALNGLAFTGTITRAKTESTAKDSPAPITLVCKNGTVESEWLKVKGFPPLQCKPGGFHGKHFSIPAEIKNDAGEEARMSLEVDDFKKLKGTLLITKADKTTATWSIEAKATKEREN